MFLNHLSNVPERERELNSSRKKGFTLIELLVVIAVIGLLSSIVLVSMKGAREKARISKAKEDLHQFRQAIIIAEDKEDKVIGKITGSWCSDCSCRGVENLNTLLDSHPCIVNMTNAFTKIGLNLIRDPWGSPYLLDENENEPAWTPAYAHCRNDYVASAGPNRIYIATEDAEMNIVSFDDDGPGLLIPLYVCPPYTP